MMTDVKEWLHVCKYFYDSNVHRNVILSRAEYAGVKYKVFSADHRSHTVKEADKNIVFKKYPSAFRFFLILRSVVVFLILCYEFRGRKFKLVFCHTWVVDGLIGFLYKKVFGVPYVIMVRNTDLNFYYTRYVHLRWVFRIVLKSAMTVSFVSHANKRLFEEITGLEEIAAESRMWPNGLEEFWFDSQLKAPSPCTKGKLKRTVVFVGKYDSNKNLYGVYRAVSVLRQLGHDVRLTCVGGTSEQLARCLGVTVSGLPPWLFNEGFLAREELLRVYRTSNCLCVPSFRETFGLVYLEALSQCLPIVISRGQGVDGLFRSGVFPVDPSDDADIARGLSEAMCFEGDIPSLDEFHWYRIGSRINNEVEECIAHVAS
jgi:glycosyltransferase involved in cell wall biosynthesis